MNEKIKCAFKRYKENKTKQTKTKEKGQTRYSLLILEF